MPSLHKDPRGKSPFWYCAYYLPDGRRAFKSTKLRNRSKAMQFCLALERASKNGHRGALTETLVKEAIREIVGRETDEASTQEHLKAGRVAEKQANKLFGEILSVATSE